jgi:type II secretory pathway component GspD/PulD (secretin)
MNQQIMKEEVGVKVSMTPHINEDNQITLALEPEVSNILEWRGPDADMPLVKVRKASTTVRVENGQTIFLAGLLSEEKSDQVKKLPILGDIPLLGMLFQHKRESVIKSNLIIEITPRIIKNPADLSFETDLKAIDKKADTMMKQNLDTGTEEQKK